MRLFWYKSMVFFNFIHINANFFNLLCKFYTSIEIQPINPRALRGLGRIKEINGDFVPAMNYFERADYQCKSLLLNNEYNFP